MDVTSSETSTINGRPCAVSVSDLIAKGGRTADEMSITAGGRQAQIGNIAVACRKDSPVVDEITSVMGGECRAGADGLVFRVPSDRFPLTVDASASAVQTYISKPDTNFDLRGIGDWA